jgi:hypothetical protein
MKRRILIVVLAFPALIVFLVWALSADPPTVNARDLAPIEIFAYRDWQSTNVKVAQGDGVQIRASGEWLYTPGEWNGPEGHPRYPAPGFYPVPGVRGGALIGKIGESGDTFYVGAGYSFRARQAGQLYLRIDDDILSDNKGKVRVQVSVQTPEDTECPPGAQTERCTR